LGHVTHGEPCCAPCGEEVTQNIALSKLKDTAVKWQIVSLAEDIWRQLKISIKVKNKMLS